MRCWGSSRLRPFGLRRGSLRYERVCRTEAGEASEGWGSCGLEALFGECAAGGRLQIFFEGNRLRRVAERNVGLDPPWPVFRCMRDFSGIVLCQPRAQVVSDADIEMFGIEAFKNIDVFHWLPCRRSSQDTAFGARHQYGRIEPGFALRATQRQPSLTSLRWSAAW